MVRRALRVVQQLEVELLGGAIVAIQFENFADDAASGLPFDLDNQIDGLAYLRFDILEGRLGVAAENEIGKAAKRLHSGVRVDGSQRSGVAGVEGIEQRSGFDSAHFTEDDPVRSPTQSGLQEIVERDAGLESIGLAFDG